MALKATIYKVTVHLSDMDRNYYQTIPLTIARHPSETEQRLMVRILAFLLNAEENLQFTKGLSTDEEPEIWQKSYSDEIEHWIELGQIDEKRIKKGCSQGKKMSLYCYGTTVPIWWSKVKNKISHYKNLEVFAIDPQSSDQMSGLLARTMELQCSIDSGQVWLGNDQETVHIVPELLFPANT